MFPIWSKDDIIGGYGLRVGNRGRGRGGRAEEQDAGKQEESRDQRLAKGKHPSAPS